MFPSLLLAAFKAMLPSTALSIAMFLWKEVKERSGKKSTSQKEELSLSHSSTTSGRLRRLIKKSTLSILNFACSYQIPMLFACYFATQDKRRRLSTAMHIGGFLGGSASVMEVKS